jgi:zinc-finger-containing domain
MRKKYRKKLNKMLEREANKTNWRTELAHKHFPDGCIYCSSPVLFADSKLIYGRSYGNMYICSNESCRATVGIHKEGEFKNEPLGRLANAELRHWKQQAHAAFDQLWLGKTKIMTRKEAYKIMGNLLNLDESFCHIGMFNIEQCQELIQKLKDNELIVDVGPVIQREPNNANQNQAKQ